MQKDLPMEKLPMEWVDKLFMCMNSFYGARWSDQFKDNENLVKALWQSGLTGLSYDEIKETLLYYKWIAAKFPSEKPPHQMEFFRSARSTKSFIEPKKSEKGDPAVAREYLQGIKQKLGIVSCRT